MEKKWDEQMHQESIVDPTQSVALISEKEYEYGADVFDAYMKESKGEIKSEMKEVIVEKTDNAR